MIYVNRHPLVPYGYEDLTLPNPETEDTFPLL